MAPKESTELRGLSNKLILTKVELLITNVLTQPALIVSSRKSGNKKVEKFTISLSFHYFHAKVCGSLNPVPLIIQRKIWKLLYIEYIQGLTYLYSVNMVYAQRVS